MFRRWSTLLAIAALGIVGCDGGPAGPQDAPRMAVQFQTGSPAQADGSLAIAGTNGTLVLDDVRLIVAEFELELADGGCDDAIAEDDCEDLELPAQFVQLPLQAGILTVLSQEVPAGVYEELEFEVEDLDLDDGEDEDDLQLQQLWEEIRAEFPDWPAEASMLIDGTFTPRAGSAKPFRVLFKAEIEVEMEFEPPLVILEEDPEKVVTVTVDPAAWFIRPDGTVLDLSVFDFAATGQLVEFEVEMEDGFTEIEFDG